MTTLAVDTDLTRSGIVPLRHLAERIADSVSAFQRDMAAFEGCWGVSDEIAQAFQREFLPQRDDLIAGCWATVDALEGLADRGSAAMDGLEHVENGNRALAARSVAA